MDNLERNGMRTPVNARGRRDAGDLGHSSSGQLSYGAHSLEAENNSSGNNAPGPMSYSVNGPGSQVGVGAGGRNHQKIDAVLDETLVR